MDKQQKIDLNEMYFTSQDSKNNEVLIGYSPDKKHILFTKTSGIPFESEDDISKSLFFKAISILAIETELIKETDDIIPLKGTLSEDKFYIISNELPNHEHKLKEEKKNKKHKTFIKSKKTTKLNCTP